MRITDEEKKRQYRTIYQAVFQTPRIQASDISSLLHTNRNTASNRLNEAFSRGYISKPQIRKRSYQNMREYLYLLTCKNPVELFPQCLKNDTVVYHAVMSGPANLWVVSKEELEFDCDVMVGGPRSDYHISYAPDHSWETAIQKMRKKVKTFNSEHYSPDNSIKTHFNESVTWDSEHEKLFREFNYDLRRPITPIIRKNLISWGKVDAWLKNLSQYCTIVTCYYPESISAYDPYLFMFETDYEDFLVDLFSELPTTSWFFTVLNTFFMLAHVKRECLRVVDFQIDIKELQIPFLVTELLRNQIIQSEAHAIVECYWNKNP